MTPFTKRVLFELAVARTNHEPMRSSHEAFSVILEELEEFWDQVKLKVELRSPDKMLGELIQIAAMAQRAAEDLDLISGGKP